MSVNPNLADAFLNLIGTSDLPSLGPDVRPSAKTPAEIEFRVVSLPPTISNSILPRYSLGAMSLVESP